MVFLFWPVTVYVRDKGLSGKMFDEDFANEKSVIHRLDPRVKIVIAAAFSSVISVSSRWIALAPGLVFSVSLVLISGLPIRKVCLRLVVVNSLILFLWFFLPFSLKGTPCFTIGPFTATKEGMLYVLLLTLRSNIIVLALVSLVSTIPIFALGRAMGRLCVPNKIVQLFLFTYRYLHVIHLEYLRLVNALKIRGFRPTTSMHTYKTYAYLFGMLLVKSYDRSERVRKAMLCRGFKGKFYDMTRPSLRTFDLVTMLLMCVAVVGIALLQWTRFIY